VCFPLGKEQATPSLFLSIRPVVGCTGLLAGFLPTGQGPETR
jgi:hypothetical protein